MAINDVNVPLINGVAFSWANVTLLLFEQIIEGITEINYAEKQDKVNNYGRGNEPVSRGRKNKEYSADITLEIKEVMRIQKAIPPGKSLTDIAPFDIQVVYQNDEGLIIKDRLVACEFTDNMRSGKQGDAEMPVKLNLLPGKILFNS